MRGGCNLRRGASPGCRASEEDWDKGGGAKTRGGGEMLAEIRESEEELSD